VSDNEQTILEEIGDETDSVQSLHTLYEAVLEDEIIQVENFQVVRVYLTSIALLYLNWSDTQLMRTHENQRLYRYRRQTHLLPAEEAYVLRNLAVDSGVEAGWFWINKTPTALVEMLLLIGLRDGLDNVKVGVLQLVSRIDVDLEFAKIKSIVDQSDSWVAATALEVYGWRAPRSGVDELEEYLEHESSDVAEAAWQATLDILARHDPDEAIDWLREPTPLRQSNVTRLMAPVWSSASNESVRLLLEDEGPVIRRKAFEDVKGELAENDIRKFTDDEDVSMRAAAYNELIRRGVRVDEQELEEKLRASVVAIGPVLGSHGARRGCGHPSPLTPPALGPSPQLAPRGYEPRLYVATP
jgi:hypothetical protein